MKRNKSNIKIHYGIGDFFKHYLKESKNPVTKQIFHSVINDMNTAVANAIVYNSYEFRFPNLRFDLSIVKKKNNLKLDKEGNVITKWLLIDYQATKKLWKEKYPNLTEEEIIKIPNRPRVYNRNKHSYGYTYKWYMNKFTSNCTNKSVYFFETTRTNKRNLAAYIKSEDFKDYYFEI